MIPKQFIPTYLERLRHSGCDETRVLLIAGFLHDFFHDYAEHEGVIAMLIYGRAYTTEWKCDACHQAGQVTHHVSSDPRPVMIPHGGCTHPPRIVRVTAEWPGDYMDGTRETQQIWPHVYAGDERSS